LFIIVLFLFLLYIFFSFWILITSSLWTLYFGLELQWMLLTIFIINGSSVWRGLLNYLMMNGIISIWLIIGILLSNSLFFILGSLGKVGYFPFYIVLGYQYYSSSYIWMIYDLMNKWAYFGSLVFIIHHSTSLLMNFGDWFVLMNLLIIIFFIKFVLSIKHLILISSLQLFLFILCGLYFEDELYSIIFLMFYSITTIYILWDSQGHMDYFIHFYLVDLINIKHLIVISALLLVLFWLILFSFFPIILFLSKFFFLVLFINHSLGWVFSLVIFLVFIFQGFYIRTMVCVNSILILIILFSYFNFIILFYFWILILD